MNDQDLLSLKPRRTIELLKELEALGFDNEAFWRLHHKKEAGKEDTIEANYKYFESMDPEKSTFKTLANPKVQLRLQFVLDIYKKCNFPKGKKDAFVALAEAAYRSIQ